MNEFDTWLLGKKIDAEAFAQAEPELYTRLQVEFLAQHPESFLAQKKFLINPIRRRHSLLKKQAQAAHTASTPES